MTRVTESNSSVLREILDVWRSSPSFRCVAVSCHFYTGGFALGFSLLPFWYEVVLEYTQDEVEMAIRVISISGLVATIICLPIISALAKRTDPSKMSAISGLLAFIIAPSFAHSVHSMSGQYWQEVIKSGVICGLALASLGVCWTGAQSVLLGWIVDDDQVRRAMKLGAFEKASVRCEDIPARRDGIINSFKTAFSFAGAAWPGVFQVILGALGYDGERFIKGERQPEAVRSAVYVAAVMLIPMSFVAFAVQMAMFPLRGARLEAMQSRYTKLYTVLMNAARVPTDSPKTWSAGRSQEGCVAAGKSEDLPSQEQEA